MRSPLRWLDAILPGAIFLGLILVAGERPLAAQTLPSSSPQTPAQSPLPSAARPGVNGETDDNSPMLRQMNEQQAMKRNDARQKLIVNDTARLVNLAQELKDAADKGTINKSNAAHKVEEIEKLAKAVKDKMREGQ